LHYKKVNLGAGKMIMTVFPALIFHFVISNWTKLNDT